MGAAKVCTHYVLKGIVIRINSAPTKSLCGYYEGKKNGLTRKGGIFYPLTCKGLFIFLICKVIKILKKMCSAGKTKSVYGQIFFQKALLSSDS